MEYLHRYKKTLGKSRKQKRDVHIIMIHNRQQSRKKIVVLVGNFLNRRILNERYGISTQFVFI